MPNFCAAYGCGNKSCHIKCINEKISFHRFPLKNPELLKQWLDKMRRENFQPTEHSKICSVHFKEDDFTYQLFTNRRLLKADSVPTIFNFQKPMKKRKQDAFLDSSSRNNTSNVQIIRLQRKQSPPAKLKKSGPKTLLKTENRKTSVASGENMPKITVNPSKKPRTNAKVLDESLFWDFVEGIVMTKDGRYEKKLSVGCATIVVDWNSMANQNSLQPGDGLHSESAVKFKVHINAPELNTSVDWKDYNKLCELGSTRAKSSSLSKENLNLALNMIDQLKMCVRRLKLENANLLSEKENPIFRNLLKIKQDATDGKLPAIILLNKIASYSAQTN